MRNLKGPLSIVRLREFGTDGRQYLSLSLVTSAIRRLWAAEFLEQRIPLQPWTQRLIWNREADSNRLLKLVRDELIAASRQQKDDGKTD